MRILRLPGQNLTFDIKIAYIMKGSSGTTATASNP